MSGVKVTNERHPDPIANDFDDVAATDDGDDNESWDPGITTEIPPGNDPGDVLTWDGDSWEPTSPHDQWKQPVRVATTANVTIATGLNNGDTLDGVTIATGDRVLVKDQSAPEENGIYVVGATPERAADMDQSDEVLGAVVYVIDGTTNASTMWSVTNATAPVVDTDAISWANRGASGSGIGSITDGTTTVDPVTSIRVPNLGVVDNGSGEAELRFLTSITENALISVVSASGTAQTLDCSLANVFVITLTANCTLTISNVPPSGVAGRIWIVLIQGGTGSYTVAWPAEFKWQSATGTNTGSAPTLYTAVGAQDVIQATTIDGGTTWGAASERVTGGTVTSVGLTVPAEFSVSGSPVTSSGTLAVSKATQSANTVWAGPTTGSAAQPTFRALVAADIPAGVGTSASDASIWRPLMDGTGNVVVDGGTGEAIMAYGPA